MTWLKLELFFKFLSKHKKIMKWFSFFQFELDFLLVITYKGEVESGTALLFLFTTLFHRFPLSRQPLPSSVLVGSLFAFT